MKVSRKQQLLNRLVEAQEKYPEYSEMFEAIRLEVSNNYPHFNSHSTWEIVCPICGESYEVEICHLYNGHFTMCATCRSRFVSAPAGQVAGSLAAAHTPESAHKAALTRVENGVGCYSSESRSKAALTKWSTGVFNSETSRKGMLTQWSQGSLSSDTARKAALTRYQTKSNI